MLANKQRLHKMNVRPLSIEDLSAIAGAQVATQNAVLSALNHRVYQIANQAVHLQLGVFGESALKVALQFNGQNIVLGISESLANALLKSEGGSLAELNEEILNLIIRLKLIPKLPQGVEFKGVYVVASAMPEHFQVLGQQVSLQAVIADTGESLNWQIGIYAMPQTSLAAFLKCFEFLVSQKRPSPLLKAKIPMPLIAARTSVPAEQLRDIAVGDVILIA